MNKSEDRKDIWLLMLDTAWLLAFVFLALNFFLWAKRTTTSIVLHPLPLVGRVLATLPPGGDEMFLSWASGQATKTDKAAECTLRLRQNLADAEGKPIKTACMPEMWGGPEVSAVDALRVLATTTDPKIVVLCEFHQDQGVVERDSCARLYQLALERGLRVTFGLNHR